MKKKVYLFSIIGFLIFSCKSEKKEVNLVNLNGYWEIDHVITVDGNKKQYGFNAYVDYFKTENENGFRSKVKPQFGGKYESNQQKINYRINTKNDSVFLTYESNKKTWNDFVLEATAKQICLQNDLGNLYFYKPYTPITIDEKK